MEKTELVIDLPVDPKIRIEIKGRLGVHDKQDKVINNDQFYLRQTSLFFVSLIKKKKRKKLKVEN